MECRDVVAGAALAALSTMAVGCSAGAATATMTTIAGIVVSPLEQGRVPAGSRFGIGSVRVGPVHVDPARKVRFVKDTIAKVLTPVFQRAWEAGIIVITQDGRTWEPHSNTEQERLS